MTPPLDAAAAAGRAGGIRSPRIDPVDDALHALELFSLSPLSLGGVHLRGWHGPRRQALLGWLRRAFESGVSRLEGSSHAPGWHLMPHHTEPDQLDESTDLTASLQQGRPVARAGLIERYAGGVVVLQRAERASPGLAARLAAALDERRFALIVLDESLADEEGPWAGLLDRLALSIDLRDESAWRSLDALAALGRSPGGPGPSAAGSQAPDRRRSASASSSRDRRLDPAHAQSGERALAELCRAAQLLGIDSMRRVVQASTLARISVLDAMWASVDRQSGSVQPRDGDLEFAVRQVLLPRARTLPALAESAEADPPPPTHRAARSTPR